MKKELLADYEKVRLDYIWKHDEKVQAERDKKMLKQGEETNKIQQESIKLQKTIIKDVKEQNKVLLKILNKLTNRG